jgi:hypothetical protein
MIVRIEESQLNSPVGPDGMDSGMLRDMADRLFGKGATTR